jgi:hypothetical protein
MDELRNYIFYSICEKSYELFEKTSNYSTYVNFCTGLKNSIELEKIDYEDSHRIMDIFGYIKKIYGLEYDESGEYVKDFFLKEKYRDFERPVRLIKEYFSNSLN